MNVHSRQVPVAYKRLYYINWLWASMMVCFCEWKCCDSKKILVSFAASTSLSSVEIDSIRSKPYMSLVNYRSVIPCSEMETSYFMYWNAWGSIRRAWFAFWSSVNISYSLICPRIQKINGHGNVEVNRPWHRKKKACLHIRIKDQNLYSRYPSILKYK